jgi:predicted DCC family thiol-disulfide oxidoreductase YuxK
VTAESGTADPGTADPGTATVVYDGDCGFCTWTARHGQQLLPADVTIQPWQRSDLRALGLTEDAVQDAVQWVPPDGQPRAGHRAIAAWLIASGLPWSVLGRLLLIPPVGRLAAIGYRVLVRHRHQIPGPWRRSETCAINKQLPGVLLTISGERAGRPAVRQRHRPDHAGGRLRE